MDIKIEYDRKELNPLGHGCTKCKIKVPNFCVLIVDDNGRKMKSIYLCCKCMRETAKKFVPFS